MNKSFVVDSTFVDRDVQAKRVDRKKAKPETENKKETSPVTKTA